MSKEEYKKHLCDIICMVFRAEDAVNKEEPELLVKLKAKQITPEQYLEKIADEILSHTPENLIPE